MANITLVVLPHPLAPHSLPSAQCLHAALQLSQFAIGAGVAVKTLHAFWAPEGWFEEEGPGSDLRGMRGVCMVGLVFSYMAIRNFHVSACSCCFSACLMSRMGQGVVGPREYNSEEQLVTVDGALTGKMVGWEVASVPVAGFACTGVTALLPWTFAFNGCMQTTIQTIVEKRKYAKRMKKTKSRQQVQDTERKAE